MAAIGGYAAQRAYFAFGEPDPRTIGPSLHTPYFWRMAISVWWGTMAAGAGWRWPGVAEPLWRAFPWVVGGAVVIAAVLP